MNEVIISRTIGKKQKKFSLGLPVDWTEVSSAQALKIFPYVLHPQHNDVTLVKVLQLLCADLPKSVFLSIDDDVIYELVRLIDWMHTEPLSVSIVTEVKRFRKMWYMPKSKLENVTCLEYMLADEYYTAFLEKKEEADLDRLCAVLLRPKNWLTAIINKRDDIRIPLSGRREVEKRALKFKKLAIADKLYILSFFSGCKLWIHDAFSDDIFVVSDGEESEETASADFGWYGVFQNVAEGGVFGNLDKVLNETKFFDVCVFLVRKKRQADKQLEEHNRRMARLE